MGNWSETVEGYVVDIACIRKYPRDELIERARVHTKACATMGHCAESGYGLVDESGQITLLEAQATPMVFDVTRDSARDQGIKLRAQREMRDEEMQTTHVEEV